MADPKEVNTSSLGNLLLILGGVKKRFIGLNESVNQGDLVYITRPEDGMKIPVIVDAVEQGKRLNEFTDEEWKQAGHISGWAYVARFAGNGGEILHGHDNASDELTASMARYHLEHASANSFTFHVATRSELLERGADVNAVQLEAADTLSRLQDYSNPSIRSALEFAANTGVMQSDIEKTARRNIVNMQREIGHGGQGGWAQGAA